MRLRQELATLAPFPASCISTHTFSLHQEELIEAVAMLSATELTLDDKLSFDVDKIIMQDSCSNIEEQLLSTAAMDNLCADSYWHDYHFTQHEQGDAVAGVECSVEMWENWLQATSPYQNVNNSTSSSACSSISPGSLSGESSLTFLTNMDSSFVNLSQVCSDVSSCSSGFVFGDEPMTYSGSTTSTIATSDDFFNNAASSSAIIANHPPQALNFTKAGVSELSVNLKARASQPPLNLKARASHLQKNPQASFHTLIAAGSVRNSKIPRPRQRGKAATILVESSTAATADGHVWLKYGQKNIKGSMYPRSYFKCALPDCPAKKQTESSSDKPGCVLITYFGKHNH